MTDTAATVIDPARDARLEKLRQRSGSATPASGRSARRRHPALGAKVLAAGLGASTMFGIVTALALEGGGQPAQAAPLPVEAPRQLIVVHHNRPAPSGDQQAVSAASTGPIALTAQPVVRVVQAQAAAPVARTNGSR